MFIILPRYVDGVDTAPEHARKTDKVFLQHIELTDRTDGILIVQDEEITDELLEDPKITSMVDKIEHGGKEGND